MHQVGIEWQDQHFTVEEMGDESGFLAGCGQKHRNILGGDNRPGVGIKCDQDRLQSRFFTIGLNPAENLLVTAVDAIERTNRDYRPPLTGIGE